MAKVGRTTHDYLLDLADWIEKVEVVERAFAENGDVASLINELALSRALEVTGEICGRLIAEFPEWASDKRRLDLDDAYRMRNKIVHGYDTLDTRPLLTIARESIPDLRVSLNVWLLELGVAHAP